MKPSEYEAEAMRFSKYPLVIRVTKRSTENPESDEPLPVYPALAICGEVAELVEKVVENAGRDAVCKELGDVLWYVTAAARDVGYQLDDVLQCDDTWPPSRASGIGYDPVLRLVVAAGKVADLTKKAWRDGTERKDWATLLALREAAHHMLRVCDAFSLTMTYVAKVNIEKLLGRRERGTLAGSGDDR